MIRWESDSGVTIEGVLYLPEDFSKETRYPLLVIAHGGPGTAELAVRRDWEDCWVYPIYQMLGRGCVVLKPNYRGSDGYGRAFHDAPFGSGGAVALMLRDVEAGVRHLVQQGMVDPSRVGLAGWSAGGAIAAYAAVHSTCFRAVSAGCGHSDPLLFLASSCYPGWPVKVYVGYPWEAREAWLADAAAWSRIAKATPTLIQHGDDDPICTPANANALYLTLAKQGTPVVFVRFPGHGHGVFNHSPRSAFTVMTQNLKWFSHHLLDAPLDWETADDLEE
jgi:dipeptidyl aminopeptidase/acylaminoacyl peptidase